MEENDFPIIKRTCDGLSLVPSESELFEKRIIFLSGEITDKSAEKFLKQYMLLYGNTDSVTLIINSPGGKISSGFGIVSAIKSAPFKTNVFCPFGCYSMAAVIFSLCTGVRTMAPFSKLMFHEPRVQRDGMETLSQAEEISLSMKKDKDTLAKLLSEKSHKSLNEIKKILGKDRYFSAKEAAEWGFCDKEGVIFK